jgi:hypothetical protein
MKSSYSLDRRQFLTTTVVAAGALMFPGLARAANIREISGVVYINKQQATANSVVRAGDLISTSHNGRISFSLGEDAYMLKERSSMRVEADSQGFINVLRLFTGKFLGVFARAGQRNIVTSTATIGIRGTACFLDVGTHDTYFCTCYGETELRTDNINEKISATHHNAHTLHFDGMQVMSMQASSVTGHSDDELRQLEAYVGRVPPFDLSS